MLSQDTPAWMSSLGAERRLGLRRRDDRRFARRDRELEAARRITEALGQHLTIDALVERAILTVLDVVGAEGGSILLASHETEELIFHHFVGPKPVAWGTAMPWDQGLAGEVFHSNLPIIIHDVSADLRHYKGIDELTGYQTHDLMALPLKRWEGEPIGVLEVVNKREGQFDQEDLSLLSIISALTAIAIERARLFQEAKLAEIARLVGDIGHDIKNMLMPIICGTGLLESEVQDLLRTEPLPPDKAQAMTDLTAEVTLMVRHSTRRIQDRMKEIAECVKGRSSPPNFAPCEIRQVIKVVFETLNWVADEKRVALRCEGLDQLPTILADEHRLFNAFYNLVNNAIPEVPPGGSVTVTGRPAPEADSVLLEFRDTGRGMVPEVRDSLFTTRVRSTKSGGTGLGTKIVKDVVDAHGGAISVTSELGVGTTFSLRLPLQPLPGGPCL